MRSSWLVSLVIGVFLVFGSSGVWADVVPGDVITAANKEKVKGLLPDGYIPFVVDNFEELEMHIVETQEYPVHPKFREATVKYACQASLDEKRVRWSTIRRASRFPMQNGLRKRPTMLAIWRRAIRSSPSSWLGM
jgi:hypothetical protein